MANTDEKQRSVGAGIDIPSATDRGRLPVPSSGPSDLEPHEPDDDYFAERIQAVFSSQTRAGEWDAPDHVEAQSVFGEIKLDFTRASLPPDGIVEIQATSIFGNVEITVPPGSEVKLEGTPIFGSIEHKVKAKSAGRIVREFITGEEPIEAAGPDGEDPPLFRVIARSIFGAVIVLTP